MASVCTRVSVAVALALSIGGLSFTSNAQQGQPAPRPPAACSPFRLISSRARTSTSIESTGWIAAIPAATRRGS